MSKALTLESMSPQLRKVAERAQREPDGRFQALAHLLDVPALARAYYRLRAGAAAGVDGVTKESYGQGLGNNLRALHERLRTQRWRHQPIRRVHIPKEPGKTRPLGISTLEDKIVQDAIREVLEAIYEQDFLDCSFGFRPARSAHDAIRAMHRAVDQGVMNWILEADIVSFFDSTSCYPFQKRKFLTFPSRSFRNNVSVLGLSGNKYSCSSGSLLIWIVPL
jgi:RNA-directed DNA polymerase